MIGQPVGWWDDQIEYAGDRDIQIQHVRDLDVTHEWPTRISSAALDSTFIFLVRVSSLLPRRDDAA